MTYSTRSIFVAVLVVTFASAMMLSLWWSGTTQPSSSREVSTWFGRERVPSIEFHTSLHIANVTIDGNLPPRRLVQIKTEIPLIKTGDLRLGGEVWRYSWVNIDTDETVLTQNPQDEIVSVVYRPHAEVNSDGLVVAGISIGQIDSGSMTGCTFIDTYDKGAQP